MRIHLPNLTLHLKTPGSNPASSLLEAPPGQPPEAFLQKEKHLQRSDRPLAEPPLSARPTWVLGRSSLPVEKTAPVFQLCDKQQMLIAIDGCEHGVKLTRMMELIVRLLLSKLNLYQNLLLGRQLCRWWPIAPRSLGTKEIKLGQ